MTALRLPGPRRHAVGERVAGAELALLWAAGGAMAAIAVAVLASPSWFDLPPITDQAPRLLAAVALYLLSHVLRFLRLALLIHQPSIRLRRVLQAHFLSSGLGVLLPFKLSELVRVREVGVVTGSLRTGVLAVWLERTLDAAVLILLVGIAAATVPGSLELVVPLLVVLTVFAGLTVVLIAVLPSNIRELMLHIVRRPSGERSVGVLRLLRTALATLQEAPAMLRGRVPTLVLLSALIWASEVAVVAIAISGSGLDATGLSTAVLSLLATVSSGATALMPAAGEQLADALRDIGGVVADVGLYRVTLVLPLLVAGAWSTLAYAPWRGRRGLIAPGARV